MGDLYEKYFRFGLVLERLAVLKKNWADYEQLFGFFFMFSRAKNIVGFALENA